LRCELDWNQDIAPVRVEEDGNLSVFQLRAQRPFLYFKPVLKTTDGKIFWGTGLNILAVMSEPGLRVAHPKFFSGSEGRFLELVDNYEVNLPMATALIYRGWKLGHDLQHFTFPNESHNERAWGRRLHLPAQVFARSLREINALRHGTTLQDDPLGADAFLPINIF
jgi:hypothetical protein